MGILKPDGTPATEPEGAFFGLQREVARRLFAGHVVLYDERGDPLVTRPLTRELPGLAAWLPAGEPR